ncbi:MAG: hypothetical protein UX41_C0042G0002 [Candidatus Collierbacteria bacterium GW2011_GWE1_46_18]|uniref:Uncharacterized protein n=3 Tax=Candidatus Collieribacteriota TaxID=1752725 RepID=A0A0G1P4M9_9BACT|nr:MAG: hypothetical protein UX41_C0042G0002 [Candidatus Collierbacteria bacterium GW2011_GWE1_46_18]
MGEKTTPKRALTSRPILRVPTVDSRMETRSGSINLLTLIMNQDKNTIKAILALGVAVILGEGILGWGIYWPILLMLSDWDGIFWLGLIVGILVAIFGAISVGLPSLFIVVVLGLSSFSLRTKRGSEMWLVLISLAANGLMDKIFGLSWGLVEMVGVLVAAILVFSWEGRGDSIKVHYK